METLEATIEDITYHNPENGYFVGRLSARGQPRFTAVGTLMNAQQGARLSIEGGWMEHPTYGRQFKFEKARLIEQTPLDALRSYLASGAVPGVGPVIAEAILNRFGDQTQEILSNDPRRLIEVPGVGPASAKKIAAAWKENQSWLGAALLMHTIRLSERVSAAVHKKYGDDAEAVIRDNPYRLVEDNLGVSFSAADSIAQQLGFGLDSLQRFAAGVEHALTDIARDGHVYAEREETQKRASKLLGAELESLDEPLKDLEQRKRVVVEEEEGGRIYLRFLYDAESRVARQMRALTKASKTPAQKRAVQKALAKIEKQLGIQFSEKQREAVHAAAVHPILILTGGPGTGKTTAVRAVLSLYQALKMEVELCAPTGRAAKRLSEVTGAPASTIHRLLRYSPADGDFYFHAGNPLKLDALIVDETSMIDILLMKDLLDAVPAGARLVFVGDVDQLPSVGPGNVLKDVIRSEAAHVVELDQIFRQAQGSLIVTNAHRVNRGDEPEFGGNENRDCFFVQADDLDEAESLIVEFCQTRLPDRFGFDPAADIQAIAPMRRGKLSTETLNEKLQKALNGDGAQAPIGGGRFHIGDKVMQIRNNYNKEVFNGDIGFINRFNRQKRTLAVRYPDRLVEYRASELAELTHAYAVTVHKSQGCQFPAVALALHTRHYMLLQRNLLYTAITRAQRLLLIVGSAKALRIAVERADVSQRNTRLVERIKAVPVFGKAGAAFKIKP
ncbi:MAG: ATP-dependent RecD-like DNA helicase [Candidatus Poribacteria bacterium]|nr:ATP-dependent RecD-like DNA helicase [Candidatus Poribacteria bacterium]